MDFALFTKVPKRIMNKAKYPNSRRILRIHAFYVLWERIRKKVFSIRGFPSKNSIQ